MTLELRCGEVVHGCDGVVRGDSRDEVLRLAADHAAQAHGLADLDPATERALADAVREV